MPELNDETRAKIDAMSPFEMLRRWRFAPVGSFQTGDPWTEYFMEVMEKSRKADPDAWVRASKELGW